MPDPKRDHVWCIRSCVHNAWWRSPTGQTQWYTRAISEAGRFTFEEAQRICDDAGVDDDGNQYEFYHLAPEYNGRIVLMGARRKTTESTEDTEGRA